jgi:hypothetical protein
VATAGCGFILGNESLAFEADPATVSDSALDETGYEEQSVEPYTIEETFSAVGQERTVEVTNHLAKYERAVDLGPLGRQRAAVFTVLASPNVEIAGESFNPIDDWSTRKILDQFDSQYEGLSVGSQAGSSTATLLGAERAVERYEGTASLSGQEVEVYVEITGDAIADGGDFVVPVAVYPQRLDGEQETVRTLLNGVEH